MKLHEKRNYAITLFAPVDDPRSAILDSLKFLHERVWEADETSVHEVKSRPDEGVHKTLRGCIGHKPSDSSNVAEVIVTGTTHVVDMSLHVHP